MLILSTTAIVTLIFLIQIYFIDKNSGSLVDTITVDLIEPKVLDTTTYTQVNFIKLDSQKVDSIKILSEMEIVDSTINYDSQ